MSASMLSFISGLSVGFLVCYLLKAIQLATLKERLRSEQNTKGKLQSEFKLAAVESLENANKQFLSAAMKDFGSLKDQANQDITSNKDEIESSVSDMKAKLDEHQKMIQIFENERSALYARLEQSLGQVLSAEQSIRMETSALKNALTASAGIRGKWGERVLQEILEQSNLVRGINFETQTTLTDDQVSDARPDFIIYLPGGKKMIVDSKEVSGEYLLAQETDDPAKQKEHYQKLVGNIRTNFIKLSRKEYQTLLDPDIPFVVMFIPSEAAIRAAFSTDPGIFQEATQKRVILASPMTIMPLVYLISHGWRQYRLAQNAQELGTSVEELGNRLFKFIDHLHGVRSGIKKTVESWDKAIGSWQGRVAPQIERTKNLGGQLKDSDELTSLDSSPRHLLDDHLEEPLIKENNS